jgi:chorismate mutase/prephenate dehydratase
MVKLESRPTKHENWSYFFFVDLEGHIEDRIIAGTIKKMSRLCLFLKCLGSYPMANEGTPGRAVNGKERGEDDI